MATVEISSQLRTDIHQRMFFGNPGTATGSALSTSIISAIIYMIPLLPQNYYTNIANNETYQFNGRIDICKGAVPTDFSGLTAFNSRSTDVLLTIKSNWPDQRFGTSTVSAGNPMNLISGFSAASQSGTATWFILRSFSQAYTTQYLYHQIVGTVGTTGSGSDLEISSTNIVSGNAYRITNLRFQIPTSYTY